MVCGDGAGAARRVRLSQVWARPLRDAQCFEHWIWNSFDPIYVSSALMPIRWLLAGMARPYGVIPADPLPIVGGSHKRGVSRGLIYATAFIRFPIREYRYGFDHPS